MDGELEMDMSPATGCRHASHLFIPLPRPHLMRPRHLAVFVSEIKKKRGKNLLLLDPMIQIPVQQQKTTECTILRTDMYVDVEPRHSFLKTSVGWMMGCKFNAGVT
jgi:hypothetical protein